MCQTEFQFISAICPGNKFDMNINKFKSMLTNILCITSTFIGHYMQTMHVNRANIPLYLNASNRLYI